MPKHGGLKRDRMNGQRNIITDCTHSILSFSLFLHLLLPMLLLLLLMMKTIQRRNTMGATKKKEQANHVHTNAQLCSQVHIHTLALSLPLLYFFIYIHIQQIVAIAFISHILMNHCVRVPCLCVCILLSHCYIRMCIVCMSLN